MIYFAHQEALLESQAYRLLRANVSRTLAAFELSMPEWILLGQLSDSGELRLNELAALLQVEASQVTILVKELHKKELLTLRSHPEDNRAKLIVVTEKTKQLILQINTQIHQSLEPLMKDISSQDIAAYFRVLKKIISNSTL